METISYLDFEIRIEKQGDHYVARVVRSPAGTASGTFVIPFSKDKLELLLYKVATRIYRGTRRVHTETTEAAYELGKTLFESLFSGEVLDCFRKSLNEIYCKEKETGLRLKMRFLKAPELADLPWEFLYDASSGHFLAQSHLTPVVRYAEMPRIQPLPVRLPLKVLAAVSCPEEYPWLRPDQQPPQPLDVKREKEQLEKAVALLEKQGKIEITWLEHATLSEIQRTLRREKYHIFHFIGHGGFDDWKTEEGALILEDGNRRAVWAGALRIGTLLHDHRSLRLAVLNACEGARISRNDPFSGVATTLIQRGIPAVVAMQFEITDEAAIVFADEFYTALSEGQPADAAVAEARKAVYFMPNDLEWGTPVLYMRCADGVLFDLGDEKDEKVPAAEAVSEPDEKEMPKLEKQDETPVIEVVSPEIKTVSPDMPPEQFVNDLGMEFVYIQPGTFMMGSPENEEGRYDNEKLHKVTLTGGFYMQTTQVTAGQWRAFVRDTDFKTEAETDGGAYFWTGSEWKKDKDRYWDNPGFEQTDEHPVTCVSWNDSEAFIKWLNQKEGKTYRLPTEAEWEYTCRAGSETAYCFGNDIQKLKEYAWYWENSDRKTHPVVRLKSNAWGLYDMHGNVFEWCSDWYGEYSAEPVTDPTGADTGSARVHRGGSWDYFAQGCRSACRNGLSPGARDYALGFRLLREAH